MLTIALTGGIGSGKSAVTDMFRQLDHGQGLAIIDSDTIARNLLAGSLEHAPSKALLAVYDLFGPEFFDPDKHGQRHLNRSRLREQVFSSKVKKKQLEDLLHPLVYQQIFSQIDAIRREQPAINIIIIAIPLLFETGSAKRFDRALVIDVPRQLQVERSIQRDHCARELIEQIIDSQVSRQTRLDQADDVIDNSGTLNELFKQVKKMYRFYCNLAQASNQPESR